MALKIDYSQLFNSYRFATIDPGMVTAIQHWSMGNPLDCEIYRMPSNDEPLGNRIDTLTHNMSFRNVNYVIIEAMDFRMGSARSMASAGRGNLSLLAYIIGAITHRAVLDGAKVLEPVKYCQWGGQLTYKQLRIILEKKFGFYARNDHEAAAYGIGLWAKGEL